VHSNLNLQKLVVNESKLSICPSNVSTNQNWTFGGHFNQSLGTQLGESKVQEWEQVY